MPKKPSKQFEGFFYVLSLRGTKQSHCYEFTNVDILSKIASFLVMTYKHKKTSEIQRFDFIF